MKKNIIEKLLIFGIMLLLFGVNYGVGLGNNMDNKSNRTNEPISSLALTTDWWVMFHHDPGHTGYSTSTAPNTNTVLWTFNTGLEMSGSPSVVDGKVYVGSWDKKIYCLDANTGSKLWEYLTGLEITSSPAVAEGKVYIGSNDGKLYCLDAMSGGKIWNYTTGSDVVSSPTVFEGKVYVGSRDHKVYCLDANSGTKIWEYATGDDIISSPAVYHGMVYIGSWDDKVYCLNASNGVWIWDYTTSNDIYSSPATADNNVFIGSSDNKVYCLNALTGAKLWDYATGASIESSPAVANGKVYVGSFDNTLYCLDAATGDKIWDFQAADFFYSSPAVADGKVYAGSFDHKIYCFNAETGAPIWSHTSGYIVWASPAVAEGRVYIGSGDHKVYCFMDPNTPPNPPAALNGPENGFMNIEYNFSTNTTDNDGDDVFYFFDWGDDTNSSWLGPYPSGVVASTSHTWTAAGDFSVKVKAKDTLGAESNWSAIHSITIAQRPILEIQTITGGLFKVKTSIKNIGDAPATNINWSITLVGGAWIGKVTTGKIISLGVGEERTISSKLILGFGKTVVTVTAEVLDSATERSQNGTILLFFIRL